MNAVERQIKEINRLYEEIRKSRSEEQKAVDRVRVKELEDDLLEYCSWRKLDYNQICTKIVK